ncbi:MAG: RNA 2',3'-cyclic phosphodiesterase [Kiritimatiellia bacterium]|jgi:2'-5' RNA ligase|nr:RNA 2',3'-cyclic phosphodiesterase [Kiritimatiellia bacterium]MDP6809166.1 RNA 2',3'-cyclic phosphodiesterase [Kiritimatiellia bacterium]
MRTFIAIEIDSSVRAQLAAFQRRLRATGAQVRWTRPETMHLTLAFLGEVPDPGLEIVRAAMELSVEDSHALHLEVEGIGTFGSSRSRRIVWADLRGDVAGLQALQSRLAEALLAAGFETEDRPFSPHITLGRIHGRRNMDAMMKRIDNAKDHTFGSIEATAITLFKSELRPAGALHTPIYHAHL